LRASREAGLEALGISDHIVNSEDLGRPWLVRERLPADTGDLRVYVGCETEMATPAVAKIDAAFADTLDFVIMSASHLFNPGVQRPGTLSPEAMAAHILEMMRGAIALGFVDIIAHPFSVPVSPVPFEAIVAAADQEELRDTAALAACEGVAMECNPAFLRGAPEAMGLLIRCFLEVGCKLAVNSDAHHPAHIGCRGPQYASEEELRAAGVTEDCLWRIEDRRA